MILLEIADWRLRLECQPVALQSAINQRYAAFIKQGPPDITIRINMADPGPATTAHAALESRIVAGEDSFRINSPGVDGTIDFARRDAAFSLRSATPLADVEYLLRTVLALIADSDGGLLVHAAGLLTAAGVSLFIGASGSGKSTVTALSPQAIALNDDLVAVRRVAGRWMAFGTPFWNYDAGNRMGETKSGPVAAVYRLVQDHHVALEPLSRAQAVAELVSSCPVVNGIPSRLGRVMAVCAELAGEIPVRRLRFLRDDSFWRLIDPAAEKRSE